MEARSRFREAWLWRAAAILVAVAWLVVLRDPAYRDLRLQPFGASAEPTGVSSESPLGAERDDPSPGVDLSRSPAVAALRAAAKPSTRGYLLAWIGDCASCSGLDLVAVGRDAAERRIGMLVVASRGADTRSVRKALDRAHIAAPIVEDTGSIARTLNPYYVGRLYYFGSDWRLRWMETGMRADSRALRSERFVRAMGGRPR